MFDSFEKIECCNNRESQTWNLRPRQDFVKGILLENLRSTTVMGYAQLNL